MKSRRRPKDRRKPKKIKHKGFKGLLLSGFLVLIPVGLTIYVVDLILDTTNRLFNLLPVGWRPPEEVLFPGSGLVLAVVAALVMGLFVRFFIGRYLLLQFNRVMDRIPFIASLYGLLRQISEVFLGGDGESGFKRVVMVEWPRKESWMIAFVPCETKGQLLNSLNNSGQAGPPQDFLNLFVPTTPNPTSGFFFMVPKADVIDLSMTVEMAFKVIVSGGTLSPDEIKEREMTAEKVRLNRTKKWKIFS